LRIENEKLKKGLEKFGLSGTEAGRPLHVSFPRRRESRPFVFARSKARGWIPAFAGMTAPSVHHIRALICDSSSFSQTLSRCVQTLFIKRAPYRARKKVNKKKRPQRGHSEPDEESNGIFKDTPSCVYKLNSSKKHLLFLRNTAMNNLESGLALLKHAACS